MSPLHHDRWPGTGARLRGYSHQSWKGSWQGPVLVEGILYLSSPQRPNTDLRQPMNPAQQHPSLPRYAPGRAGGGRWSAVGWARQNKLKDRAHKGAFRRTPALCPTLSASRLPLWVPPRPRWGCVAIRVLSSQPYPQLGRPTRRAARRRGLV